MPRTAIIGGSGFYCVPGCNLKEKKVVRTKYGDATLFFYENEKGAEFVFLPRHGEGHTCAPHRINYRANVIALKEAGIERIIGISSVGSLREAIRPGDFVLLDQFLDFTKARPITFFDEDGCVVHTDMTEPYCHDLRQCILSAPRGDIRLHDKGTYVCTEGPRFETAAEIRMYATLGGDVVGMTGVPEVVLARELGMCYAGISVATNYAAGISKVVTHEEVLEAMKKIETVLASYVVGCITTVPEVRKCTCKDAPGKMN
ncbi:S-methyl-5'-thioadenosine phosphorylase [Methanocella arvoryzae]|uniref:Probable 6-oxopurine nucleoside phosphorylase n=1 Tax=Methanocella arvoryzae (strain DSM 22066 / NBRC 105507 / MRE50) TaxID=351160 RepID=Q0W2D2_METAR|nr:S-methyl-5'-thioadenosine phosphorylase [Methanocella arvoryzae]CAJ37461.1 putative purine phosphorylase (family 2) [Methanocella arvoryzae MRE50]